MFKDILGNRYKHEEFVKIVRNTDKTLINKIVSKKLTPKKFINVTIIELRDLHDGTINGFKK